MNKVGTEIELVLVLDFRYLTMKSNLSFFIIFYNLFTLTQWLSQISNKFVSPDKLQIYEAQTVSTLNWICELKETKVERPTWDNFVSYVTFSKNSDKVPHEMSFSFYLLGFR